jgi:hypothetical protein
LDRYRLLDEAACWLLTSAHALDRWAEPVRREAGSPCKSAVTEFTNPTGNEYRARRVVEQVLTNQNSSLNRLPEADLVGQEVALRHIA